MVVQAEIDWQELAHEAIVVDAEGVEIEPFVSVTFGECDQISTWWTGEVEIGRQSFDVSFNLSDVKRSKGSLVATFAVKAEGSR